MRIRAEGGWTERGNQSDCLHDEDLASSATGNDSDDSSAGKAALRACGSMPIRQHNQRRSRLFHRLALEHKGRGATRLHCGGYIDQAVPVGADGQGPAVALPRKRSFPMIHSQAHRPANPMR